MKLYALSYGVTLVIFFGLDILWLSVMGGLIYRPVLGDFLLEKFNLGPAVAFYLLYVAGVVVFAVSPALTSGRWTTALWSGALLGLLCYATYDLTNQSTLKRWSTALSVIDMSWGMVLTAVSASLAAVIVGAIMRALSGPG